ncbi:MAG: hypothetical protein CL850_00770 [Crocinitomicaceae bacterium]|nr:hypothetical protein [Crocinitomicaceae bacterium]|tara:strand:- start:483 stop:932 length:450 start_codon:yes stop_codon:yes gene_type:complete
MKISDILAIAGKPGLYKVIASSNKNLVVESMVDGKRSSVPGSVRVSNLSDITMYTFKEDVPLRDILNNLHKKAKGHEAPAHNSSSSQEIKDFVDSAVSDLDHDRIYNSDLKKLVQWYNILLTKDAFPLEDDAEIAEEKTEKPAKEKSDE